MGKWQIGIVVVFALVYCLTVAITGNPSWILVGLILAALLLGYAALNWWIGRRIIARKHHGNREEAMADNEDSIPAAHVVPDDETATGDTPEVHSEVNVHDFPLGNPARRTIMEMTGSAKRTTGGHASGGAGGPTLPGGDRTAERSEEPEQRSAPVTPTA